MSKQMIFTKEDDFWNEYYSQTGDWSVGPAVTISTIKMINDNTTKNTKRILEKHTTVDKSTGKTIYILIGK